MQSCQQDDNGEIMDKGAEDLIRAWAADWTSGNLTHLLSLFAEECVYEDVAFGVTYRGKAELKSFAESMRSAFPDLRVNIDSCFATGKFACAEWKMSGTHRGDLPDMPAGNKSFTIRGSSVFEFESSRIRRCSDYWDQTTLLKQL
jgi:steroid delta-isomerase-like uncharacterized protein